MIRRVIVQTTLEKTLFCLCLLSAAAKREVLDRGGRLATNGSRQPPSVSDRPPMKFCTSVFLSWSRDVLEVGSTVGVQASANKGVRWQGSGFLEGNQPSMHASLALEAI